MDDEKQEENKNGYHVDENNYGTRTSVWVASLEIAAVQFAIQIAKHRDRSLQVSDKTTEQVKKEARELCHHFNYMYLRKKNNGKKDNYLPTKLQREIIENGGY